MDGLYGLLLALAVALGGRVPVEASATPPAWVVAQTGTDLRRGAGEIRGYWYCQNPRYDDCRIWVAELNIHVIVEEGRYKNEWVRGVMLRIHDAAYPQCEPS